MIDAAKALQVSGSGMNATRFVISLKQRAMAEEAYSGGAIEALLQADLYPSNLQPGRRRSAAPSRVRAALAAARVGMWFEGWLQGQAEQAEREQAKAEKQKRGFTRGAVAHPRGMVVALADHRDLTLELQLVHRARARRLDGVHVVQRTGRATHADLDLALSCAEHGAEQQRPSPKHR